VLGEFVTELRQIDGREPVFPCAEHYWRYGKMTVRYTSTSLSTISSFLKYPPSTPSSTQASWLLLVA
jgi:hypothetical protein